MQVQVVPRASATAVAGRHGEGLRIRVAAPPVDGAANLELVRFLAKQLGVRRDAVTIVQGLATRRKTILIVGLTTNEAIQRLLAER
ncbi:MAG TPA: DUF167 domain-containing protein [Gemmatimonadales bacterium]